MTITLLEILNEVGADYSRNSLEEFTSRSDWPNDKKINALVKQILNKK